MSTPIFEMKLEVRGKIASQILPYDFKKGLLNTKCKILHFKQLIT